MNKDEIFATGQEANIIHSRQNFTFTCRVIFLNKFCLSFRKQKQKAETISGPTLAEQYIVIADYKKADKWDLNLKAGMVLEVIEKSDSGELY